MRRLFTPRWLLRHLLMIVLVAGMLGLAWWQLTRAAAGHMLSWGYTLQWPVFAGFVFLIWAREVRLALREDPAGGGSARHPVADGPALAGGSPLVGSRPVVTRRPVAYDDQDDPELAAYNHYLAWLNAHPTARPADYPGPEPTNGTSTAGRRTTTAQTVEE